MTRYSPRGLKYRVWEVPVARISPSIAQCSFYLYTTEAAARNGERIGGSGFLVAVPAPSDHVHLYAVTNKHVYDHGCNVLRLNTKDGQAEAIRTQPDAWTVATDDDLAVLPLGLGDTFAFSSVSTEQFAKPEMFTEPNPLRQVREEDPTADWPEYGYGDEVVLVGRLISHEGKQRNKPIVRYGSLSMLADPSDPIHLENGSAQEAFLVECRSLSGFSGSPVFIYPAALSPAGIRLGYVGDTLLGVDCSHVPLWKPVFEEDQSTRTSYRVEQNTGIAVVIPAWRLLALLNQEHLMTERAKKDAELTKITERESRAVLDIASDAERPFTRADFEQALKKVSRKLSDSGTSQTSDE